MKKIFTVIFALFVVIGSFYIVFAGVAGNFGGGGGGYSSGGYSVSASGRAGYTNVDDKHGNPVGLGYSGPSRGGFGGGGGGDGGDGGGGPWCVPCVTACTSAPNACKNVSVGTQDVCCGRACTAKKPKLPDYYGKPCQIGDTGASECSGTKDCAANCSSAPCMSVQGGAGCVSACYATTTPPEDPDDPDDSGSPNNPGGRGTSSESMCSSFELESGASVNLLNEYEKNVEKYGDTEIKKPAKSGEKEFQVKLMAIPKLVKKGRYASLVLIMKNVDSCDIASSDGRVWRKVGKDSNTLDWFSAKINAETKFRIVKCYFKNEANVAYIPVANGWRCVVDDSKANKGCNLENVFCIKPDGSKEKIKQYSLCAAKSNQDKGNCVLTSATSSTTTKNAKNTQGSAKGYQPGTNLGSALNLGSGKTTNSSKALKASIPALPDVSNDTEETVYLSPSWQER